MPDSLRDWHIVLTRPTGQNEALAARICAVGGEAVLLPLLDIAPPAAPLSAEALHELLTRSEWAIFISPNAVRMALRILPAADWPTTLRLAAIGQGTARVLREAGLSEVLTPASGSDSESLLALAEFAQPGGKRILLARGEGGRELLAQTLTERGAQVNHAVVYRRLPCPPDLPALRQQFGAGRTLWVITSSEALRVLLDAAQQSEDVDWLHAQQFLFAHPRIAQQAATSGLNHGIMALSPEDDAVFTSLLNGLQTQHP